MDKMRAEALGEVHPDRTGSPDPIYLYCVGRAAELGELDAAGLDGEIPVALHSQGSLVAVVGPVELSDFTDASSEERLADITWIGPRAFRHQEVINRAMLASPVIPTRFGTIFSSLSRLEEVIEAHYDGMVAFLDRIAGCEEWAFKVYLDRNHAVAELFSRLRRERAEALDGLDEGTRYLRERRLEKQAGQEVDLWLRQVLNEIISQLDRIAADAVDRPLLSREATGRKTDMVTNRAYLVDRSELDAFRASVDAEAHAHHKRGVHLELSGPWPVFSFSPTFSLDSVG